MAGTIKGWRPIPFNIFTVWATILLYPLIPRLLQAIATVAPDFMDIFD
jgi:hypothetical protein